MRRLVMLAIGTLSFQACHHIPETPRDPPVVSQIDHVMIVTNERARLEALLSDTLQLPVVWPSTSARSDNSFVGIAFGDVHLELVPRRRMTRTELNDFAFQPTDIATTLPILRARGLAARDPDVTTNDAGEKRWTIIGFRHPFQAPAFFIMQYHAFDQTARRARFDQVVRDRRGGPLGLTRVREFRMAYPGDTLALAHASWKALLGEPVSGQPNYFRPSAGPAIRLIQGSGPQEGSILIEVASLREAAAAARSLGMLRLTSADSVVLDPARFGGLRFVLVERRASRR